MSSQSSVSFLVLARGSILTHQLQFLLVDGVLALTMGPEFSQAYHSKVWPLLHPQALSACAGCNGVFIIPADTSSNSASTIILSGRRYHIIDYAYTTLGQMSRVLQQGVYCPKAISMASEREGLLPPVFFTIGGRLGIPLLEAARKKTDILDNHNFPAPLRNKTTGYLCIHVSTSTLDYALRPPDLNTVARISASRCAS